MLKTDTFDKGSWEKTKYNDPYELKDDDVSNTEEQDANLFSSFNLPQMCLSSVIDMYKNKPLEAAKNHEDLKENLSNGQKFSTARKLFEKSSEDTTSEDYFNLEAPVPAVRSHVFKSFHPNLSQTKKLSLGECQPQISVEKDEENPVVDLTTFHTNNHPAHCHEDSGEAIYYEQPWDLSNTQGNLEDHLQNFFNKALPG